jgi:hypothetical protein
MTDVRFRIPGAPQSVGKTMFVATVRQIRAFVRQLQHLAGPRLLAWEFAWPC